MAIDRTRYRQLDFIGARILQARELNWLQEISEGVGVSDNETPTGSVLQTIYRQGAMKNVTVSISGLQVTLSATDGTKPMEIFVRNQWETYPATNDDITDHTGTYPANHVITLSNIETVIYLNWEYKIRTGGLIGDDTLLTDAVTNEAVASAGELILHLSNTDTSGVALSGAQLAKNVTQIQLLTFTNSGTLLTLVPKDNVLTSAKGSPTSAGLVTTTTSNSQVVSTDDARMSNTRAAADGSVHDSSVRVPTAIGGVNADGTPVYNLIGDIGGISAAKIILTATTQLLSDAYNWLKTQFLALQTAYNAHFSAPLGQVNTHPIPTPAQVGAAPASHVGLPLGLTTSHPPVVNVDSGGFRVNRSGPGGTVDDPAFGVFESGSSKVSLNHDGDISSNKAGAFIATPGGTLASGALTHLSLIAQVLSQHVNQVSHANPHGLSAGDIGAASVAYVDAAVAGILAASENYTNSYTPSLSLSSVFVSGPNISGTYLILRFAPNNGNGIEIAYGSGTATCTDGATVTIPLPNGSFSSGSSLPSVSVFGIALQNGDIAAINTSESSLTFGSSASRFNGSGSFTGKTAVVMSWTNLCWRQGA